MEEREADQSTRLEIDEAILDYLLFTAINALVEESRMRQNELERSQKHGIADLPLQLVDC